MLKVANALVAAREKELIGRKLKAADRARLLREWQETFQKMTCILGVGEADAASYLKNQRDLRCKVWAWTYKPSNDWWKNVFRRVSPKILNGQMRCATSCWSCGWR